MSPPAVTPELKALLRRVKLGRCLDTLPERLALAQTGGMGHAEFLELVLADEVTRRETTSADRRAHAAGLDASIRLERWDDTAKVGFDRAIWNELVSLRFVESGHNAVIMGPVGVGKTFLATALGHIAVRRPPQRALRALRPSPQAPARQPARQQPRRRDEKAAPCRAVDHRRLRPPAARRPRHRRHLRAHRRAPSGRSPVVTSNREPIEWLGLMADPLLAQSAIDRLQSAAHELVLEGDSYRPRQKPGITKADQLLDPEPAPRRSSRRRR